MKEKKENTENLFGEPKKGYPFRVPENYFETFADRLMARIEEEERPIKKRSLFIVLKPALMVAASLTLVMLLVYVPVKKFLPADKGYLAKVQSNGDSVDSAGVLPATLISYFSEGQFLSAVSDLKEIESDTLSTDNLADFIAANYTDYDIIANN